jgi:mannobiose 2-epimerase
MTWGRQALALGQRAGQDLHAALAALGSRAHVTPAGGHAPATMEALAAARDVVEGMLARDVLPHWTRESWDEAGGFVTDLARDGRRIGSPPRHLVSQARMVWTLAAAHRHGLTGRGYLRLAELGVRFLLDRMWDRDHGGLHLVVRPDGTVLDGTKDTCANAYALHALAEYALAAGDAEALEAARALFDVLARRAAAGATGYAERFGRDWAPLAAGAARSAGTHLHLLSGFGTLAEASGEAAHREALGQVADLLLAHAIDRRHGCVIDHFDASWRPRGLGLGRRITSYGHSVEMAWMLLEAGDRLGWPREPPPPHVLGLVDHALAHGFDRRRGGLASYGPPSGHVTRAVYLSRRRLHKLSWPQAELLVALAEAYRRTRDPRYWDALALQLGWIRRCQADPEGGDWFTATTWTGRPIPSEGRRGTTDPYHHGRALMRVARALRALAREGARAPDGTESAA